MKYTEEISFKITNYVENMTVNGNVYLMHIVNMILQVLNIEKVIIY